MTSLVDYRKFDGIGDDIDDDDTAAARAPRVTRLDNASTIQIGGGGWHVAGPAPAPVKVAKAATAAKAKGGVDYSKWDSFDDSDDEGAPNAYYEDDWEAQREEEAKEAAERNPAPPPTKPAAKTQDPLDAEERFGTAGGAPAFAWSQTAAEVRARFGVPAGTKAADVAFTVDFVYAAADAGEAPQQAGKCVVSLKVRGVSVFEGLNLMHDVWCDGDDRPDFRLVDHDSHAADLKQLDWEVADAPDLGGRALVATFQKRHPARDLVVWWPRLFAKSAAPPFLEPDVDTTKLAARNARPKPPAAAPSFQSAWDEAHAAFQQRTREPPQIIDV
ncbi:hypothetical protein M885DRAFT_510740 [Pelagophyceae sp. CCMP2097]|nr:hypothetical protein M885DRAFT_510740 [Pelagophyceae sp. CCMP2097]